MVVHGSVMAVVKANAYGHGSVPIARAALRGGAQRLGVYTVEEGVLLRTAGIRAPILVFGPFDSSEGTEIIRHGLTPTITSIDAAWILQSCARGEPVRFHLKVDSGLNRAGVAPEEAITLMQATSTLSALVPEGVYTHFASADEIGNAATDLQLDVFLQTVARLEDAGFTFELRHAANSAATLYHSKSHLDMVRCGICLYGYDPVAGGVFGTLRPVLHLASCIARLHTICAATGVGYGHEFRCERETTIALIPIGYGDGLPRSLGNGRGRVIIRGKTAPIVGRVSMDQITVDVTDLDGISAGDAVTLIGSNDGTTQTATDLGDQAGTIDYEILTRLMPRVPRVYWRDGHTVSMNEIEMAAVEP